MKEVKLFRTVTGQDMIGTLVDEDELHYTIEKPMFVMPNQQGGNLQVGLSPISHPALGFFDGQANNEPPPEIEVNRGSIMFVYNPSPALEANYSQATGTIKIATKVPGNL